MRRTKIKRLYLLSATVQHSKRSGCITKKDDEDWHDGVVEDWSDGPLPNPLLQHSITPSVLTPNAKKITKNQGAIYASQSNDDLRRFPSRFFARALDPSGAREVARPRAAPDQIGQR